MLNLKTDLYLSKSVSKFIYVRILKLVSQGIKRVFWITIILIDSALLGHTDHMAKGSIVCGCPADIKQEHFYREFYSIMFPKKPKW